jgi:hypothetical protein
MVPERGLGFSMADKASLLLKQVLPQHSMQYSEPTPHNNVNRFSDSRILKEFVPVSISAR